MWVVPLNNQVMLVDNISSFLKKKKKKKEKGTMI